MDFSSMTKQQLKEYGETIGVKLDLRKKKVVLIEELNNATTKEDVVIDDHIKQPQAEFDIKQYIWLCCWSCDKYGC